MRAGGRTQAVEQVANRVDRVGRGQDRDADLLPGGGPGAGRVWPELGQAGEGLRCWRAPAGSKARAGSVSWIWVSAGLAVRHVLLLSGAPDSGRDTSGLVPRVKAASTPASAASPNAYTVRVPAVPPAVSSRTQAVSSCPVALLYRRASRAAGELGAEPGRGGARRGRGHPGGRVGELGPHPDVGGEQQPPAAFPPVDGQGQGFSPGQPGPARSGQVAGHRAAGGRAQPGQGGGVAGAAGILVPGAQQVTLPGPQHLSQAAGPAQGPGQRLGEESQVGAGGFLVVLAGADRHCGAGDLHAGPGQRGGEPGVVAEGDELAAGPAGQRPAGPAGFQRLPQGAQRQPGRVLEQPGLVRDRQQRQRGQPDLGVGAGRAGRQRGRVAQRRRAVDGQVRGGTGRQVDGQLGLGHQLHHPAGHHLVDRFHPGGAGGGQQVGNLGRQLVLGPPGPGQAGRVGRRLGQDVAEHRHYRGVAAAVPGDQQAVPAQQRQGRGAEQLVLLGQLGGGVLDGDGAQVAVDLHQQRAGVGGQAERRLSRGLRVQHGQPRGRGRVQRRADGVLQQRVEVRGDQHRGQPGGDQRGEGVLTRVRAAPSQPVHDEPGPGIPVGVHLLEDRGVEGGIGHAGSPYRPS